MVKYVVRQLVNENFYGILKCFERLMATISTMVSNVYFDVLAILATYYHKIACLICKINIFHFRVTLVTADHSTRLPHFFNFKLYSMQNLAWPWYTRFRNPRHKPRKISKGAQLSILVVTMLLISSFPLLDNLVKKMTMNHCNRKKF